jgi:hypothetical protein
VRWHYRDPLLLWLFPAAFAAHVVEESLAGETFPVWLARVAGEPLPFGAFLVINLVGVIVVAGAVGAATRRESAGWLAVAIATLVSLNALLHLAGTVVTAAYSPGLITAVVLYAPLGGLTLLRAGHQMPRAPFLSGVCAGVLAHALVSAVAFWLARG